VKKEEEEWVADPPTGGGWPPLRPWGWLGHHQTGRSGGGSWPKEVAKPPPPIKEKEKKKKEHWGSQWRNTTTQTNTKGFVVEK
jgi:hypothetical protein